MRDHVMRKSIPRLLIAITFPLLYGAMFGDVGHGLVVAAFGWLVASKVVPALRGLAALEDCWSFAVSAATIFGFIYGSVFGFEEVLPHLIRPSQSILQILGIAIAVGIVLLNIGILLNLYNAVRARDWPRFFFDSNGLAGWIFICRSWSYSSR